MVPMEELIVAAAEVPAAGVAKFGGFFAATFLVSLQLFRIAEASYVPNFHFVTPLTTGRITRNGRTIAGKGPGKQAHLRSGSDPASRLRPRLSSFAAFRTFRRFHGSNP